jgi:hypothetical protein
LRPAVPVPVRVDDHRSVEVFDILEPGGVFANLEHVASPTHRMHLAFYAAIGEPIEDEDPSDRLLDVETQLR